MIPLNAWWVALLCSVALALVLVYCLQEER